MSRMLPPEAEPAFTQAPTDADIRADAMEVLQAMRAILDDFPIEWQVNIVRALFASTIVSVAARLRSPVTLSA